MSPDLDVDKQELNVGGLRVWIYSTADTGLHTLSRSASLAAVIGLHGRTVAADSMDETARKFVRWAAEKRSESERELVYVTFVGTLSV
jgi:hypothetical protein